MEWAEKLDHFVSNLCEGKQYDSCVSSPCRYASQHGCQHPQHPKRDPERNGGER